MISLSGFIIVLGILVDDAIIVAESIYRRYELGDSPIDAAVNGLAAVFRPVMTTLVTTFLPSPQCFIFRGLRVSSLPLFHSLSRWLLFASAFGVGYRSSRSPRPRSLKTGTQRSVSF